MKEGHTVPLEKLTVSVPSNVANEGKCAVAAHISPSVHSPPSIDPVPVCPFIAMFYLPSFRQTHSSKQSLALIITLFKCLCISNKRMPAI